MNDMSLDNIAEREFGIVSGNLSSIEMTSMSEQVKNLASSLVKVKACYDNCFQLAHCLDATYVLGITYLASIPLPIAHAWLKVDGKYIDPTLETVHGDTSEHTYQKLVEIPVEDIISVVDLVDQITGKGSFAPMFESVAHHPLWCDLFTDYGRRRIQFL
ncbi:hypothetical protein F0267_00055 [Vibrio coralliilyticus]|uniref:Uncharacterized protein n=3 Tax=Vibrio TaxID=662 RepID=A0AAN0SH54_9VIBR|nr:MULTISPECIES: hypothetical protein [Vibrio]CAH1582757.1 conserved hypothetical protein [Vibrio jasicida]AIW22514.1 hypothetical protein IX92_25965 [Vibrio coralliilyticus]MCZ2803301.1 hypothetical protein [Vibrio alginolyticus]NOH36610.1 hypothetical protein [Vibrio coralliilyticus]PAW00282.1 hypothetical protein CKJ79_27725 [Vibrio coralliilyticus]